MFVPVVQVGPMRVSMHGGIVGVFMRVKMVFGQAVMRVNVMVIVVPVFMEMYGSHVFMFVGVLVLPKAHQGRNECQKCQSLHRAQAFVQPKQRHHNPEKWGTGEQHLGSCCSEDLCGGDIEYNACSV